MLFVAVRRYNLFIMQLQVIFFSSKTFLNKELTAALKRCSDIRLLCVDIPVLPPVNTAEAIFEQLKPFLPAIVVSLNDAGFDQAGVLGSLLASSGSFLLNWYYDDPLYEAIFYKRKISDKTSRIDFVSEETFVPLLAQNGFNSHFLPLATDPEYFNTNAGPVPFKYEMSFVGNSSMQFMDSIITEAMQKELEGFKALLYHLKKMYYANTQTDIRRYLLAHRREWENSITVDQEVFVFAMVWMIGYMYRKDFIVDLAQSYKDRFKCFGDIYWSNFIDKSLVSTDAMYYKNLCEYYRATKINININRIQIQTSFTQRIFDCKASGAFLLTDKRMLNSKYFNTSGAEQELVEFDSLSHCKKLIDFYLVHDQERNKIAANGREKVLANHTYDNRVTEMLEIAKKTWNI